MNILEIRAKAIPYYACYIAQRMSAIPATTSMGLQTQSWFDGDENNSPRFLLEDDELLHLALKFLEERDVLQFIEDEFAPDIVARKTSFNDSLKKLHSEPGTVFQKFNVAGDDRSKWLRLALISISDRLGTLTNETSEPSLIAAKTDEWAPIPLDRNDADQVATIETLEKIVEDLRADNGYAATHPDEKAFVQDKLSAVTKRLKEDSQISWMYLREFAFKPIAILIGRFGNAAIGLGATAARDALSSWLKSKGLHFLDDIFKN